MVLAHVNALLTVLKSPAPLVSVATSIELVHAQHCLSVSVILFGVISPRYPPEQGKMDCNMQWKDIQNIKINNEVDTTIIEAKVYRSQ